MRTLPPANSMSMQFQPTKGGPRKDDDVGASGYQDLPAGGREAGAVALIKSEWNVQSLRRQSAPCRFRAGGECAPSEVGWHADYPVRRAPLPQSDGRVAVEYGWHLRL